MTFSEPGRFRWSKEDLTVIMKEHRDITLAGPFEYMAVLPKDWKPICEAARLATIRKQKLSKEEEENLETRTVKACKKLKYNGAHARAALNIGTLNRLRYSIYGDDDGLGDGDDDGLGDGDGRGRDMKYGSHDVGRRGPHLEIRERRETHTKTKGVGMQLLWKMARGDGIPLLLVVVVANCSLVLDPHSGISRGFAFVTMETLEDANRCIKNLNQSVLDRRQITVEMVRRKRVSTNTRDTGYRGDCGDRGGDRGRGSGRDDYGYWKSQRRSPPQGGRDYFPPPRRSPSPYRGRGRDYSPPRH
ncbi:hypothetical protein CTI12_AA008980 [Artemisia annua]|uniref:RRM domain-containing protein n=1 Tax=Artemisia annua TaxID=35608 RepID=A0A2U1QN40_ARTAN|nr:hypothetical protein CTI12_AA008980 [Artemisia annua]